MHYRRLSSLLLCLLTTSVAQAAGPLFPAETRVGDLQLQRLGEYRYVYRFFFPLYEAALYTESGVSAEAVKSAQEPFHLTFRYLREIDKSIILKSADRMLEKNLTPEERAAIAERVATINEAYTGVRDGDTSSLTFQPDTGTTLRINGEPKVTIPGEDFARLYFRIWLGPKALSQDLRDHLLGLK